LEKSSVFQLLLKDETGPFTYRIRAMSLDPLNPPINPDIQALNDLAAEAEESGHQVNRHLSNLRGRAYTWLSSKVGKMPKWAQAHIQAHKHLEDAVHKMMEKGKSADIPETVIATLQRSKRALHAIGRKVDHALFLKAILPPPETADPTLSRLVTPLSSTSKAAAARFSEWELNFALLYSAYQRTDNEDIKSTIRFLMINYLAKAAFLNLSTEVPLDSEEDMERYAAMGQVGQLTLGGLYHRTAGETSSIDSMLQLDDKLGAPELVGGYVPLETTEIQELYNVSFVTTPDLTRPDEIVTVLVNQFEANLDRFPDENLEFPILIDITDQIGQSIITENNPDKITEYQAKRQLAKAQIKEIVQRAADIIKARYPDRLDIQSKISDYIITNTAIVSRVRVSDHIAILGLYGTLFDATDFDENDVTIPPDVERRNFIDIRIREWIGKSALGLGAVSFRQAIAERCTDPEALHLYGLGRPGIYAVPGKTDTIIYARPSDVTRTHVFGRFSSIAQGADPGVGEAQTLLAKVTVSLITTLLTRIPEAEWTDRQHDPAIRELTQKAAFRLFQHVATAMDNVHDFRIFSQSIDRMHAELTTLLMLYSPFDPHAFDENYARFLQPIFPEGMRPSIVGVARSAMNVFTGVNAIILKNNPNPVRICAEHSYYEEVSLVGGTKTLQSVLDDPAIDKVDIYATEFYHNIEVDPDYTHYQKGRVIEDIRSIFTRKPETDQLTVTIDATIDFAQSADIKELLQAFETEIREGKLNIVIFRSGQKFDMYGFDNYFGCPFYVINNGAAKWAEFNRLKTDEVFQTDRLSLQYFSWMTEAGPEMVDEYKKRIFDNTQAILREVPPSLMPEVGREVCVSTFEEGVLTPFIDIKIDLADEGDKEDLRRWVQQRFMELFIAEGKLAYRRGSFGFAHPNITWIAPKMRINPGIDPTEIKIYQQFFRDLAAKVEEFNRHEGE
jgi:hypothetical protein